MRTFKRYLESYPLLSALVIFLAAIILSEIPLSDALTILPDPDANNYLIGALIQFAIGFLLLIGIHQVVPNEPTGLEKPSGWKNLFLVWPILILTVLNASDWLLGNFTIDTSHPVRLISFGLVFLSTGFFEEILGRGVALRILIRRWGASRFGIYFAVLASSALFGIFHLVNFVQGRASLLANSCQILYAIFFGIFFAAITLRNHSLWPAILVHAIFDIAGSLAEIAVNGTGPQNYQSMSQLDALVSIALTLPLGLYGLYILRKVNSEGLNLVNRHSIDCRPGTDRTHENQPV